MEKTHWLYVFSWIALNIIDYALTSYYLSTGGHELNYFLTGSALQVGILKIAGAVIVLLGLWRFKKLEYLKYLCIGMLPIIWWMVTWQFV